MVASIDFVCCACFQTEIDKSLMLAVAIRIVGVNAVTPFSCTPKLGVSDFCTAHKLKLLKAVNHLSEKFSVVVVGNVVVAALVAHMADAVGIVEVAVGGVGNALTWRRNAVAHNIFIDIEIIVCSQQIDNRHKVVTLENHRINTGIPREVVVAVVVD